MSSYAVWTPDALKESLARGKSEHGERFDTSDLAPQFAPYFNGPRVKIWFDGGYTKCGRVSRTTGWRPSYLLMISSRAHGSPYLLGSKDKIVAVKRGRKYVAVDMKAS